MAEFSRDLFHILHYITLPSPSSIYGQCVVEIAGTLRYFVATRSRSVMCIGCEGGAVSCEELRLDTLGPGVEIVAISAFVRQRDGALVLGLTVVKSRAIHILASAQQLKANASKGSQNEEYALHIYGVGGGCKGVGPGDFAALEADLQEFVLPHVPFRLLHTRLPTMSDADAFLLCSSDHHVHLYAEVDARFQKIPAESTFPELSGQPSSALALQIRYVDRYRIVAVGCRNGFLHVAITDTHTKQSVAKHTVYLDGPITSLHIFTDDALPNKISRYGREDDQQPMLADDKRELSPTQALAGLHLLVGCAVEEAIVYRDIASEGLEQAHRLPQSERHDSVLCTLVADINFDGRNEIVIGTYGQRVLAYARSAQGEGESMYELVYERQLAQPLYSLSYRDLTRDGLSELVCLSFEAVYIFQHDLETAGHTVRTRHRDRHRTAPG